MLDSGKYQGLFGLAMGVLSRPTVSSKYKPWLDKLALIFSRIEQKPVRLHIRSSQSYHKLLIRRLIRLTNMAGQLSNKIYVLHCIVLHCTDCIVLYCIALHCIALHCIVIYCFILYYCKVSGLKLHFLFFLMADYHINFEKCY